MTPDICHQYGLKVLPYLRSENMHKMLQSHLLQMKILKLLNQIMGKVLKMMVKTYQLMCLIMMTPIGNSDWNITATIILLI